MTTSPLYRDLAAVERALLNAVAERRQELMAARRRILDALEIERRRRKRTQYTKGDGTHAVHPRGTRAP